MQPNETISETPQAGFDPNSPVGTFVVALALCLVCSFVVSFAAVALKPLQEKNAKNKMMRNVLIAAGIWENGKHTDADIPQLFQNVSVILWDLPEGETTGSQNTTLNLDDYDQQKAVSTVEGSIAIPTDLDLAGIKKREKVSRVYIVRTADGGIDKLVLPVYGKGLWSTLYGFLAVDASTHESRGITFYKHAETPGLGGEVDNPKWKAHWADAKSPLQLRDAEGNVVLDVTKPGNANQPNEVDGLSGATITSNGVENTIRYWLGKNAFGPMLDQLASGTVPFTLPESGSADSAVDGVSNPEVATPTETATDESSSPTDDEASTPDAASAPANETTN
ncbi:MAG: Na(+)-translocating NADH-quinone reductase subunit C [Planctomycetaceae bacterium]|nr:Na(+)-translocating NADH-quinone reductase subunit C [Planctomycetaceae bacterium]